MSPKSVFYGGLKKYGNFDTYYFIKKAGTQLFVLFIDRVEVKYPRPEIIRQWNKPFEFSPERAQWAKILGWTHLSAAATWEKIFHAHKYFFIGKEIRLNYDHNSFELTVIWCYYTFSNITSCRIQKSMLQRSSTQNVHNFQHAPRFSIKQMWNTRLTPERLLHPLTYAHSLSHSDSHSYSYMMRVMIICLQTWT